MGNEELPQFWRKRIHIVTANCLLGNPGEDAFINSQVKRYYLNRLSKYCETKDKKVVFIYDEIHDTIHNFKEQYIFNLWKWRKVIHKNFIISATYNEASKVVIEYLAELTNNKIQIIESERKRFLEKQSELFLHYNSEQFYNFDDKKITELVGDLISVGKEVDILSYSKKLAENIIKNKDVAAIIQRVTNIGVALDGMGMNTFVRVYPGLAHQVDFAIGGKVKAGAFGFQDIHYTHMGQGF